MNVTIKNVKSVGVLLSLLIALFAGASSTPGQEVTGAITGTITDPSGAPIAGATVTAQDLARNIGYPVQSNADGLYYIAHLSAGSYELKVQAKGFETAVRSAFDLVLNQVARVDVQMVVGSMTQTVEVTSLTPLLQTESTLVGTVIDSRTNESLPLAGGNYVQLTLLTPGATNPNPKSFFSGGTSGAVDVTQSGQPYINGNRDRANLYLLDGVQNGDSANNTLSYTPASDAIEEFNLISQNAPAQFGNFQGGIVNVSIKSGSNGYHGDAYEFFRSDALNANNWGNNLSGTPKAQLTYNQFGATFGGPIKKDKLFFFLDYQGIRFDQPGSAQDRLVPGPERMGNFGDLCTDSGATFNAAGLCSDATKQIHDPFNGNAPFKNNVITEPANVVAKNLFASPLYPGPNITGQGAGANFRTSATTLLSNNQGDVKIDYNLRQNDHLSFRYSQFTQTQPGVAGYALQNAGFNTGTFPARNAALSWSHTFGNGMLNDFRAGVNNNKIFTFAAPGPGVGSLATTLGIANGNVNGPGMIELVFPNSTLSTISTRNSFQDFNDTEFTYSDALIFTRGRHTFHVGADFERYRVDAKYGGTLGTLGFMTFDGSYTGDQGADFYLGLVNGFGRGSSQEAWGHRAWAFAPFVQDDWKVTPTLTLNLGLRYQAQTPWVEVHDRQVNFGLFTGTPMFANQNGNSRALYNGYYGGLDFQPRIGFAWSPEALGKKTVLRGAFTISTYLEGTGDNLRLTQNAPFVTQVQTVSNKGAGLLPKSTTDQGILAPPPAPGNPFAGAKLLVWDPNFKPAIVQQWNISVQHQFTNTTTLTVAYVGQHGTHLVVPLLLSQKQFTGSETVPATDPRASLTAPTLFLGGNPGGNTIVGTDSSTNQKYNALQADFQKRLSDGLQANVAYTYSKCMTDNEGYFTSSFNGNQSSANSNFYQNLYDRKAEWGPCYFDATHSLATFVIYELPVGRGKKYGKDMNSVADAVVGGWNLTTIVTDRSGFAITPTTGALNGNAAGAGNTRPNCSGPIQYLRTPASGQPGIQWFTASGFSQPNQFGTCGNGIVRGPRLNNVDLSVQKNFSFGFLREGARLQFRTDFFYLFNHPILNAPATGCCGSGFGVINSSQGERNIQLGLKLYF
jgi:hypothetical protein